MATPILSQCNKMLYCIEEDQFYSKAVISSVISALITTVDVSDLSSPIYTQYQDIIKAIISSNLCECFYTSHGSEESQLFSGVRLNLFSNS